MPGSDATIRQRTGLAVFAAALAALAAVIVVVVSGGLTIRIGSYAVTARDPLRPLLVAIALLAAARLVLGRAPFRGAADRAVGTRAQRPARLAALIAGGAFVFAVAWNTRAAGGSDSSCYLLQAQAFAEGHASLPPPIPALPPGLSPAVLAPTGFVASPVPPHAAVPICSPGLALVMAPAVAAGRDLAFLIVPLFAAAAVWLTFVLGRQLADPIAGVCAALLLACSPIFLYQAVQPMSDVPAAAAWLAALAWAGRGDRRGAVCGGLAASVAVLMRANLALLVLPLLLLLKNGDSPLKGTVPVSGADPGRGFSAVAKRGQSPFLWFLLGGVPGALVMLALNAARYGGPLASGYGDTGTLFAWPHVAPNLARYPSWLLATESPFVLFAVAAPWVVRRDPHRRRLAVVALISVALLAATYLAYTVFDDWWYLRFLLPALPIVLVCATLVFDAMTVALPDAFRRYALPIASALLAGWLLDVAHGRAVFDLRAIESRFRVAGEYAQRTLPPDAIVLAVQQSGSVRFHGGRATVTWDAIASSQLDAAVAEWRRQGRPVYLVLEDVEEAAFRARFAGQRVGALDWAPEGQVGAPVPVRFFAVRDAR